MADAGAAGFVVIGDFGSGSAAEYEVAAAIETLVGERPIEGFITTGDNFYNDDIETIWLEPYGWLEGAEIPVFAAWGNNDIVSETRRQLVEEYLSPPGRWYTTELGPGTLVVLDSNEVDNHEQQAWLGETLEDAGSPIVVAFHHPAFSCGPYGNTPSIIENWVPLFEQHDVALVLAGHEHHYQRLGRNGLTYVVTGGGGREIRPAWFCPSNTPTPEASDNVHHHFLILEVGADRIVGTATASDGSVLDSFVVEAAP